jgi:two-component system, cell cycle sensor histidine kinase and response regulator CckA
MQHQRNITKYITSFSVIVIALFVIIFPLGYFFLSYQYMMGILSTETEINAGLVTRIINADPERWEFQYLRIQEYLLRRPEEGDREIRRVLNAKNEVIVESADELKTPFVMGSDELVDSGVVVGRIEIYRSLRPLLIRTGLVALFMLPIGLGVFLLLRNMPLRTIYQAEKALREREEKFRELYDSAPVGYLEYDLEGRITNVNRSNLEMLGYTREEMVGEFVWKFNTKEEIAHQHILAKLSGTMPQARNLERTYRRRDGSTLPVLIEDRIIQDEKGRTKGIRCSIQDITERKRTEEEREKLIHELEYAMSQVKTLSGMLPICASCKRIRDDKGYWNQIESYIRDHSEAEFSHSICPECMKKLYGDILDEEEKA